MSVEFAVLPPIVLDRISTDWVLGPGNDLLAQGPSQSSKIICLKVHIIGIDGIFLMQEVAELFQALADETRLRLVKLLGVTEKGVCVCELVDALRLPQYQVSRHLAVLKAKGLVEDHKEGTWVYYRIHRNLPPPAASLIAIVQAMQDDVALEDRRRLKARLARRRDGLCVIGYPKS